MEPDDRAFVDSLAAWTAEGRLPEMRPAKQTRSARTAAALIDAGRRLLRDRSLEDLSIEDLCGTAGTTIGAFYGRFESKADFFVTMQRVQTMRTEQSIRAFITRHPPGQSSVEQLCSDIVHETVNNFRVNLGVMRASLQHSREGMWKVIKESGDRYRSMLVLLLSPYLSAIPKAQRELRILFAYQALAGVLVHAVLNDPGPLSLEDDRMEKELFRLTRSYLIAT
jgi:AcrR family transcriptional regulator